MKRAKTAICELTGQELPKRQTTIVAGHRVSRELKTRAECLLIDMVEEFLQGWRDNRFSANKRRLSLYYMAVIIRGCKEYYNFEPTVVIMNTAERAEAEGIPLNEVFIKKLLDYAYGEPVRELEESNATFVIERGLRIMIETT